MDLTKADLEAVRFVLDGSVSLKRAAVNYSVRHKTMVAVAILVGAEIQSSDLHDGERGIYGALLEALINEPGAPTSGWPLEQDAPDGWYYSGCEYFLIERSLRYGFHGGGWRGTHGVNFIGNAQLMKLVHENPEYVAFCNVAYRNARAIVLKQRAERQH